MPDQPHPDPKTQARLDKLNEFEKKATPKINAATLLVLCMLGVGFIWLAVPTALYALMTWGVPEGEGGSKIPSDLGIVGDFFGSVNALFAGLAFLFLVVSIRQAHSANKQNAESLRLQGESLEIQQKELIESRKVLQEQSDSQRQLVDALNRVALETSHAAMMESVGTLIDHSTDSGVKSDLIVQLAELIESKILFNEAHRFKAMVNKATYPDDVPALLKQLVSLRDRVEDDAVRESLDEDIDRIRRGLDELKDTDSGQG